MRLLALVVILLLIFFGDTFGDNKRAKGKKEISHDSHVAKMLKKEDRPKSSSSEQKPSEHKLVQEEDEEMKAQTKDDNDK